MEREEATRFYEEHCDRHPYARLPRLGTEPGDRLFEAWAEMLIAYKITYESATRASIKMVAKPPKTFKSHFQYLLHLAFEHKPGENFSDRETVERESKDCPTCQGNGLVIVHNRDRTARVQSTTVYCDCLYGRWIKRNHEKTCPEVAQRMGDYADIRANRGTFYDPDFDLRGRDHTWRRKMQCT